MDSNRNETYLRKIAGEDVDISNMPEPGNRIEAYLKTIAENGGGSVDPEEIAEIVTDWLDDHVDPETGYVIDNTLLVEGAAADAKKVGDELTDLKSAIEQVDVKGKTAKTVSGTTIKLSDNDVSNVEFTTDAEMHIYGRNRLDIANATITHDGSGSTVITKTDTGFSAYYPGTGTAKSAFISYTAEFSGDLWISCKASTAGNVRDLRMNVKHNDTICGQCYGTGLLKQRITVTAGDTVQLRFLMRNLEEIANTVTYNDIMISYMDCEFVPFNDYTNKSLEVISHTLSTEVTAWQTSTAATGVSGLNLKYASTFEGLPVPSANSSTPTGLTVTGMDLVSYNATYNGTEGLGVSTSGTIMIYKSGLSSKQDYLNWFATHPITLSWNGEEYVITPFDASTRQFKTGEIIVFAASKSIKYYYAPAAQVERYKMVCFGDSITGMYGYDTDYPAMISNSSFIDAINCGFSGSTWTDYTGNMIPFSINRLIDSIVAEDFSSQDEAMESIATAWFSEHLANLKAVEWDKIQYVTFLAGVNDWYYSIAKLRSEDDASTENKQRTNVEDCVPYCITQLLTKYPHLKIIVLTPYHAYMQSKDSDVDANTNGDYLYEYAEVIKECAEKKRVPCVEQYLSSGINQLTMYYYTEDGTHPNESLKHMIADRIVNKAGDISSVNLC